MSFSWILNQFRWAYILVTLVLILLTLWAYDNDTIFGVVVALAILPGIFYIALVRYSDVGEKEPRGVVAFNIAVGMVIIPLVAWLEEFLFEVILPLEMQTKVPASLEKMTFWLIVAFLIIAPVEEGMKMFGFFLANSLHNENDQPTDSVVYAVAVAGGFAIFENFRYVIYASNYSIDIGFQVAVLRAFTAIPIHLGLGLVMGYFLSKYTYSEHYHLGKFGKSLSFLKAIAIPLILHGIYNFLVFYSYKEGQYYDIFIALLFAIVLTYFAWKWVIKLREIERNQSK